MMGTQVTLCCLIIHSVFFCWVPCLSTTLRPRVLLSGALISSMLHSSLTLTILALCPTTWSGESTHTHTHMRHVTLRYLHPFLPICNMLLLNTPTSPSVSANTHPHTHACTLLQTELNKWSVSCSLAQPISWSHVQCNADFLCSGWLCHGAPGAGDTQSVPEEFIFNKAAKHTYTHKKAKCYWPRDYYLPRTDMDVHNTVSETVSKINRGHC